MKFTISKQVLSKHIGIAQKAISNRSSMQILEGIVFETKAGKLILSSTDLELSVNTQVACEVYEEGGVVLNSELIGSIVRKMPDDLITFKTEGNEVIVTCQNSMFNLRSQDILDYPSLPKVEAEKTLEISVSDLKEAIHETLFATSNDETWLIFTGVLFSQKEDRLEFVGLDGYRMALKKYDYHGQPRETIVPKRALNELARILEQGTVDITIGSGHILFANENTKMYSKIIDKKYIEYQKIITSNNQTKLIVSREDFANSLERALLLARGGNISLSKLTISDGNINIQSSSEVGELNEDIPCQQLGKDLVISFNTRYVLEGLKAISDDKVVIYLNEPLNPMLIHPESDEDNYLYLVLPVRAAA